MNLDVDIKVIEMTLADNSQDRPLKAWAVVSIGPSILIRRVRVVKKSDGELNVYMPARRLEEAHALGVWEAYIVLSGNLRSEVKRAVKEHYINLSISKGETNHGKRQTSQ